MTGNLDQSIDLPEPRSDTPITFAHYISYWLAIALFGFFRIIGVDAASLIAGKFMRVVGPLIRSVSKRGEANLKLIYPDWSAEKINATMKDVWENLGRTVAEYAHLDKFSVDGPTPRIIYDGVDGITHLADDPGRAVFVTGHFANWEIPGICAHQLSLEFAVIYRSLNNPLIDELIIKKRAKVATRRQIPKGPAGARPMIDLLKDGYSIAVLSDQKMNAGGLYIPFMGHKAMTAPAAARISLRFGMPVIPISTERIGGARFKVHIRPPIDFTPSGNMQSDIEALTIKINNVLSDEINDRPGQWLWLHRRWKAPHRAN